MVKMHIAKYITTNNLIGIDEARNGKKCNCECYSCGGVLIARQKEIAWHFAHYKNSAKDCKYSFWVVCRDLARQIFLAENYMLEKIKLESKSNYFNITRVSTKNTKVDDFHFDLSFYTQKYGRVYVYFVTPETQRDKHSQYNTYSEHVLLIDLSEADSQKSEISEFLNETIIHSFNKKNFLLKKKPIKKHAPTSSQKFATSFFEEQENEEKQKKLLEEISKNTPSLENHTCEKFLFSLQKHDIDFSKIDSKDITNIKKLDSTFLAYVKKYGVDSNKAYGCKIIFDTTRNKFISAQGLFFGVILLEYKYVVYYAKDKGLVPLFVTPFSDSISRRIINYRVP